MPNDLDPVGKGNNGTFGHKKTEHRAQKRGRQQQQMDVNRCGLTIMSLELGNADQGAVFAAGLFEYFSGRWYGNVDSGIKCKPEAINLRLY